MPRKLRLVHGPFGIAVLHVRHRNAFPRRNLLLRQLHTAREVRCGAYDLRSVRFDVRDLWTWADGLHHVSARWNAVPERCGLRGELPRDRHLCLPPREQRYLRELRPDLRQMHRSSEHRLRDMRRWHALL